MISLEMNSRIDEQTKLARRLFLQPEAALNSLAVSERGLMITCYKYKNHGTDLFHGFYSHN